MALKDEHIRARFASITNALFSGHRDSLYHRLLLLLLLLSLRVINYGNQKGMARMGFIIHLQMLLAISSISVRFFFLVFECCSPLFRFGFLCSLLFLLVLSRTVAGRQLLGRPKRRKVRGSEKDKKVGIIIFGDKTTPTRARRHDVDYLDAENVMSFHSGEEKEDQLTTASHLSTKTNVVSLEPRGNSRRRRMGQRLDSSSGSSFFHAFVRQKRSLVSWWGALLIFALLVLFFRTHALRDGNRPAPHFLTFRFASAACPDSPPPGRTKFNVMASGMQPFGLSGVASFEVSMCLAPERTTYLPGSLFTCPQMDASGGYHLALFPTSGPQACVADHVFTRFQRATASVNACTYRFDTASDDIDVKKVDIELTCPDNAVYDLNDTVAMRNAYTILNNNTLLFTGQYAGVCTPPTTTTTNLTTTLINPASTGIFASAATSASNLVVTTCPSNLPEMTLETPSVTMNGQVTSGTQMFYFAPTRETVRIMCGGSGSAPLFRFNGTTCDLATSQISAPAPMAVNGASANNACRYEYQTALVTVELMNSYTIYKVTLECDPLVDETTMDTAVFGTVDKTGEWFTITTYLLTGRSNLICPSMATTAAMPTSTTPPTIAPMSTPTTQPSPFNDACRFSENVVIDESDPNTARLPFNTNEIIDALTGERAPYTKTFDGRDDRLLALRHCSVYLKSPLSPNLRAAAANNAVRINVNMTDFLSADRAAGRRSYNLETAVYDSASSPINITWAPAGAQPSSPEISFSTPNRRRERYDAMEAPVGSWESWEYDDNSGVDGDGTGEKNQKKEKEERMLAMELQKNHLFRNVHVVENVTFFAGNHSEIDIIFLTVADRKNFSLSRPVEGALIIVRNVIFVCNSNNEDDARKAMNSSSEQTDGITLSLGFRGPYINSKIIIDNIRAVRGANTRVDAESNDYDADSDQMRSAMAVPLAVSVNLYSLFLNSSLKIRNIQGVSTNTKLNAALNPDGHTPPIDVGLLSVWFQGTLMVGSIISITNITNYFGQAVRIGALGTKFVHQASGLYLRKGSRLSIANVHSCAGSALFVDVTQQESGSSIILSNMSNTACFARQRWWHSPAKSGWHSVSSFRSSRESEADYLERMQREASYYAIANTNYALQRMASLASTDVEGLKGPQVPTHSSVPTISVSERVRRRFNAFLASFHLVHARIGSRSAWYPEDAFPFNYGNLQDSLMSISDINCEPTLWLMPDDEYTSDNDSSPFNDLYINSKNTNRASPLGVNQPGLFSHNVTGRFIRQCKSAVFVQASPRYADPTTPLYVHGGVEGSFPPTAADGSGSQAFEPSRFSARSYAAALSPRGILALYNYSITIERVRATTVRVPSFLASDGEDVAGQAVPSASSSSFGKRRWSTNQGAESDAGLQPLQRNLRAMEADAAASFDDESFDGFALSGVYNSMISATASSSHMKNHRDQGATCGPLYPDFPFSHMASEAANRQFAVDRRRVLSVNTDLREALPTLRPFTPTANLEDAEEAASDGVANASSTIMPSLFERHPIFPPSERLNSLATLGDILDFPTTNAAASSTSEDVWSAGYSVSSVGVLRGSAVIVSFISVDVNLDVDRRKEEETGESQPNRLLSPLLIVRDVVSYQMSDPIRVNFSSLLPAANPRDEPDKTSVVGQETMPAFLTTTEDDLFSLLPTNSTRGSTSPASLRLHTQNKQKYYNTSSATTPTVNTADDSFYFFFRPQLMEVQNHHAVFVHIVRSNITMQKRQAQGGCCGGGGILIENIKTRSAAMPTVMRKIQQIIRTDRGAMADDSDPLPPATASTSPLSGDVAQNLQLTLPIRQQTIADARGTVDVAFFIDMSDTGFGSGLPMGAYSFPFEALVDTIERWVRTVKLTGTKSGLIPTRARKGFRIQIYQVGQVSNGYKIPPSLADGPSGDLEEIVAALNWHKSNKVAAAIGQKSTICLMLPGIENHFNALNRSVRLKATGRRTLLVLLSSSTGVEDISSCSSTLNALVGEHGMLTLAVRIQHARLADMSLALSTATTTVPSSLVEFAMNQPFSNLASVTLNRAVISTIEDLPCFVLNYFEQWSRNDSFVIPNDLPDKLNRLPVLSSLLSCEAYLSNQKQKLFSSLSSASMSDLYYSSPLSISLRWSYTTLISPLDFMNRLQLQTMYPFGHVKGLIDGVVGGNSGRSFPFVFFLMQQQNNLVPNTATLDRATLLSDAFTPFMRKVNNAKEISTAVYFYFADGSVLKGGTDTAIHDTANANDAVDSKNWSGLVIRNIKLFGGDGLGVNMLVAGAKSILTHRSRVGDDEGLTGGGEELVRASKAFSDLHRSGNSNSNKDNQCQYQSAKSPLTYFHNGFSGIATETVIDHALIRIENVICRNDALDGHPIALISPSGRAGSAQTPQRRRRRSHLSGIFQAIDEFEDYYSAQLARNLSQSIILGTANVEEVKRSQRESIRKFYADFYWNRTFSLVKITFQLANVSDSGNLIQLEGQTDPLNRADGWSTTAGLRKPILFTRIGLHVHSTRIEVKNAFGQSFHASPHVFMYRTGTQSSPVMTSPEMVSISALSSCQAVPGESSVAPSQNQTWPADPPDNTLLSAANTRIGPLLCSLSLTDNSFDVSQVSMGWKSDKEKVSHFYQDVLGRSAPNQPQQYEVSFEDAEYYEVYKAEGYAAFSNTDSSQEGGVVIGSVVSEEQRENVTLALNWFHYNEFASATASSQNPLITFSGVSSVRKANAVSIRLFSKEHIRRREDVVGAAVENNALYIQNTTENFFIAIGNMFLIHNVSVRDATFFSSVARADSVVSVALGEERQPGVLQEPHLEVLHLGFIFAASNSFAVESVNVVSAITRNDDNALLLLFEPTECQIVSVSIGVPLVRDLALLATEGFEEFYEEGRTEVNEAFSRNNNDDDDDDDAHGIGTTNSKRVDLLYHQRKRLLLRTLLGFEDEEFSTTTSSNQHHPASNTPAVLLNWLLYFTSDNHFRESAFFGGISNTLRSTLMSSVVYSNSYLFRSVGGTAVEVVGAVKLSTIASLIGSTVLVTDCSLGKLMSVDDEEDHRDGAETNYTPEYVDSAPKKSVRDPSGVFSLFLEQSRFTFVPPAISVLSSGWQDLEKQTRVWPRWDLTAISALLYPTNQLTEIARFNPAAPFGPDFAVMRLMLTATRPDPPLATSRDRNPASNEVPEKRDVILLPKVRLAGVIRSLITAFNLRLLCAVTQRAPHLRLNPSGLIRSTSAIISVVRIHAAEMTNGIHMGTEGDGHTVDDQNNYQTNIEPVGASIADSTIIVNSIISDVTCVRQNGQLNKIALRTAAAVFYFYGHNSMFVVRSHFQHSNIHTINLREVAVLFRSGSDAKNIRFMHSMVENTNISALFLPTLVDEESSENRAPLSITLVDFPFIGRNVISYSFRNGGLFFNNSFWEKNIAARPLQYATRYGGGGRGNAAGEQRSNDGGGKGGIEWLLESKGTRWEGSAMSDPVNNGDTSTYFAFNKIRIHNVQVSDGISSQPISKMADPETIIVAPRLKFTFSMMRELKLKVRPGADEKMKGEPRREDDYVLFSFSSSSTTSVTTPSLAQLCRALHMQGSSSNTSSASWMLERSEDNLAVEANGGDLRTSSVSLDFSRVAFEAILIGTLIPIYNPEVTTITAADQRVRAVAFSFQYSHFTSVEREDLTPSSSSADPNDVPFLSSHFFGTDGLGKGRIFDPGANGLAESLMPYANRTLNLFVAASRFASATSFVNSVEVNNPPSGDAETNNARERRRAAMIDHLSQGISTDAIHKNLHMSMAARNHDFLNFALVEENAFVLSNIEVLIAAASKGYTAEERYVGCAHYHFASTAISNPGVFRAYQYLLDTLQELVYTRDARVAVRRNRFEHLGSEEPNSVSALVNHESNDVHGNSNKMRLLRFYDALPKNPSTQLNGSLIFRTTVGTAVVFNFSSHYRDVEANVSVPDEYKSIAQTPALLTDGLSWIGSDTSSRLLVTRTVQFFVNNSLTSRGVSCFTPAVGAACTAHSYIVGKGAVVARNAMLHSQTRLVGRTQTGMLFGVRFRFITEVYNSNVVHLVSLSWLTKRTFRRTRNRATRMVDFDQNVLWAANGATTLAKCVRNASAGTRSQFPFQSTSIPQIVTDFDENQGMDSWGERMPEFTSIFTENNISIFHFVASEAAQVSAAQFIVAQEDFDWLGWRQDSRLFPNKTILRDALFRLFAPSFLIRVSSNSIWLVNFTRFVPIQYPIISADNRFSPLMLISSEPSSRLGFNDSFHLTLFEFTLNAITITNKGFGASASADKMPDATTMPARRANSSGDAALSDEVFAFIGAEDAFLQSPAVAASLPSTVDGVSYGTIFSLVLNNRALFIRNTLDIAHIITQQPEVPPDCDVHELPTVEIRISPPTMQSETLGFYRGLVGANGTGRWNPPPLSVTNIGGNDNQDNPPPNNNVLNLSLIDIDTIKWPVQILSNDVRISNLITAASTFILHNPRVEPRFGVSASTEPTNSKLSGNAFMLSNLTVYGNSTLSAPDPTTALDVRRDDIPNPTVLFALGGGNVSFSQNVIAARRIWHAGGWVRDSRMLSSDASPQQLGGGGGTAVYFRLVSRSCVDDPFQNCVNAIEWFENRVHCVGVGVFQKHPTEMITRRLAPLSSSSSASTTDTIPFIGSAEDEANVAASLQISPQTAFAFTFTRELAAGRNIDNASASFFFWNRIVVLDFYDGRVDRSLKGRGRGGHVEVNLAGEHIYVVQTECEVPCEGGGGGANASSFIEFGPPVVSSHMYVEIQGDPLPSVLASPPRHLAPNTTANRRKYYFHQFCGVTVLVDIPTSTLIVRRLTLNPHKTQLNIRRYGHGDPYFASQGAEIARNNKGAENGWSAFMAAIQQQQERDSSVQDDRDLFFVVDQFASIMQDGVTTGSSIAAAIRKYEPKPTNETKASTMPPYSSSFFSFASSSSSSPSSFPRRFNRTLLDVATNTLNRISSARNSFQFIRKPNAHVNKYFYVGEGGEEKEEEKGGGGSSGGLDFVTMRVKCDISLGVMNVKVSQSIITAELTERGIAVVDDLVIANVSAFRVAKPSLSFIIRNIGVNAVTPTNSTLTPRRLSSADRPTLTRFPNTSTAIEPDVDPAKNSFSAFTPTPGSVQIFHAMSELFGLHTVNIRGLVSMQCGVDITFSNQISGASIAILHSKIISSQMTSLGVEPLAIRHTTFPIYPLGATTPIVESLLRYVNVFISHCDIITDAVSKRSDVGQGSAAINRVLQPLMAVHLPDLALSAASRNPTRGVLSVTSCLFYQSTVARGVIPFSNAAQMNAIQFSNTTLMMVEIWGNKFYGYTSSIALFNNANLLSYRVLVAFRIIIVANEIDFVNISPPADVAAGISPNAFTNGINITIACNVKPALTLSRDFQYSEQFIASNDRQISPVSGWNVHSKSNISLQLLSLLYEAYFTRLVQSVISVDAVTDVKAQLSLLHQQRNDLVRQSVHRGLFTEHEKVLIPLTLEDAFEPLNYRSKTSEDGQSGAMNESSPFVERRPSEVLRFDNASFTLTSVLRNWQQTQEMSCVRRSPNTSEVLFSTANSGEGGQIEAVGRTVQRSAFVIRRCLPFGSSSPVWFLALRNQYPAFDLSVEQATSDHHFIDDDENANSGGNGTDFGRPDSVLRGFGRDVSPSYHGVDTCAEPHLPWLYAPPPTREEEEESMTPTLTIEIPKRIIPIPAPVVKSAEQATAVTGVVVAITSLGSSVTGGQLGVANALMRLASCVEAGGDEEEADSLEILVHPLQFSFEGLVGGDSDINAADGTTSPSKNGRKVNRRLLGEANLYAAAAVSNTLIVPLIIALLIQGPIVFAMMFAKGISRQRALIEVGWPSVLILPFSTLAEGIGVSFTKSILVAAGVSYSSGGGGENVDTNSYAVPNANKAVYFTSAFVATAGVIFLLAGWLTVFTRFLPRRCMTLERFVEEDEEEGGKGTSLDEPFLGRPNSDAIVDDSDIFADDIALRNKKRKHEGGIAAALSRVISKVMNPTHRWVGVPSEETRHSKPTSATPISRELDDNDDDEIIVDAGEDRADRQQGVGTDVELLEVPEDNDAGGRAAGLNDDDDDLLLSAAPRRRSNSDRQPQENRAPVDDSDDDLLLLGNKPRSGREPSQSEPAAQGLRTDTSATTLGKTDSNFPATTAPISEDTLERFGSAIGDKYFYYADFLCFACSIIVGIAEGFPASQCKGRAVTALIFAALQCLLSISTLVPFERFLNVLLALCTIPLSIVVTAKVFDEKSNGNGNENADDGDPENLFDFASAMAAFSLLGNVVGMGLLLMGASRGVWSMFTSYRSRQRERMDKVEEKKKRATRQREAVERGNEGRGGNEEAGHGGNRLLLVSSVTSVVRNIEEDENLPPLPLDHSDSLDLPQPPPLVSATVSSSVSSPHPMKQPHSLPLTPPFPTTMTSPPQRTPAPTRVVAAIRLNAGRHADPNSTGAGMFSSEREAEEQRILAFIEQREADAAAGGGRNVSIALVGGNSDEAVNYLFPHKTHTAPAAKSTKTRNSTQQPKTVSRKVDGMNRDVSKSEVVSEDEQLRGEEDVDNLIFQNNETGKEEKSRKKKRLIGNKKNRGD